jgi:hypothetical protein
MAVQPPIMGYFHAANHQPTADGQAVRVKSYSGPDHACEYSGKCARKQSPSLVIAEKKSRWPFFLNSGNL